VKKVMCNGQLEQDLTASLISGENKQKIPPLLCYLHNFKSVQVHILRIAETRISSLLISTGIYKEHYQITQLQPYRSSTIRAGYVKPYKVIFT
jgi:hypothetical protein